MIHEKAQWIWLAEHAAPDEYAFFEGEFDFWGQTALFSIAAETDYVLYVNGALADFGQFAGYPFEKYCDEIDITPYCQSGPNRFSLTVRYEGMNSATHIDDGAGVIFSLEVDGTLAACSQEGTRCGYDARYVQHQARSITTQLGFTSGMRCATPHTDRGAVVVEKTRRIKKRPVKKAELQAPVPGVPLASNGCIYDLGREETGYVYLSLIAREPCRVKIAYGEHLADGQVRYLLGRRDFSLDFEVEAGEHAFLQTFVRVAARYLQVIAPDGVEILSLGVRPLLYPLTERKFDLTGPDRAIYDTCVRTLRLCMHDHYEDCPWREQALYVLDSRNQMLSGYYAFEETDFARENLVFMSKGTRADGFLELTYPAVNTPAIPFFSVMYPVAVYEYVMHTGDRTVLAETMDTMLGIMRALQARIEENGLIAELPPPYWNFYEWSEGSAGVLFAKEKDWHPHKYPLILNCAFVYAAERFAVLCDMAGVRFDADTAAMRAAIARLFYNEESGLFFLSTQGKEQYSQLGNAMALLIGLGDGRTAEAVKNSAALVPATLSMLGYVYDALLAYSPANREHVLRDIREKYGYMLSRGATSFWETLKGESDFGGAGSLCHGWSAMPIYYYHKLLGKE
ncbi:MAG: hypothetical protein IJW51_03255 [Clostridia bacterium]|nr:hypothetical protein [Clostridia bacterium]